MAEGNGFSKRESEIDYRLDHMQASLDRLEQSLSNLTTQVVEVKTKSNGLVYVLSIAASGIVAYVVAAGKAIAGKTP